MNLGKLLATSQFEVNMRKSVILVLVLFAVAAFGAERAKAWYKISHINETLVGVSCPVNHGDPTVIGNYNGVLLVSCGTR